jgi:ATP/maltotriose-dependent transcriptional regulator MalT
MYLIACLVGLAATAVEVGRLEIAARLLGAADAQLQRSGAALNQIVRAAFDRAESVARAALGETVFAAARTTGRNLDQDAWFAEADLVVAAAAEVSGPAPRFPAGAPAGLTSRELEILRLVADGCSDREIADALFIGTGTVRTHLANAFGKLDVKSRTAAVAVSRRLGIL